MISLISKLVAFRKFCYPLHRRINDHITLQETERKSAEKKRKKMVIWYVTIIDYVMCHKNNWCSSSFLNPICCVRYIKRILRTLYSLLRAAYTFFSHFTLLGNILRKIKWNRFSRLNCIGNGLWLIFIYAARVATFPVPPR